MNSSHGTQKIEAPFQERKKETSQSEQQTETNIQIKHHKIYFPSKSKVMLYEPTVLLPNRVTFYQSSVITFRNKRRFVINFRVG